MPQVAGQQGAYVAHLVNRGFSLGLGGMDQARLLESGAVLCGWCFKPGCMFVAQGRRLFSLRRGHWAGAFLAELASLSSPFGLWCSNKCSVPPLPACSLPPARR